MYFAVNSLKVKVKVRTVFQNVWGEYKYHGNPYIQGTTVPCDIGGAKKILGCSSTCNEVVRMLICM